MKTRHFMHFIAIMKCRVSSTICIQKLFCRVKKAIFEICHSSFLLICAQTLCLKRYGSYTPRQNEGDPRHLKDTLSWLRKKWFKGWKGNRFSYICQITTWKLIFALISSQIQCQISYGGIPFWLSIDENCCMSVMS